MIFNLLKINAKTKYQQEAASLRKEAISSLYEVFEGQWA